jgi:glycosyltransferase involved in cell wall biosynthesis
MPGAESRHIRTTGEVKLVTRGISRLGRDGSSRYRSLLVQGLQDAGANFAEVGDAKSRWVQRGYLGGWAVAGKPSVGVASRSSGGVVHALESVSVPAASQGWRLVVTVHDLCALIRPELVSRRVASLKQLSWRRRTSWDAVIVPSHATRDDVIAFGVPAHKVVVIRHPLSRALTPTPVAPTDESKGPFALMVGPGSSKKGADVLVRAMERLRGMRGRLVWVTSDVRGVLRIPGARTLLAAGRLELLCDVTDVELARLYATANALVVPSRWEGFSFPIAEATAVGTGVVASDIPPHREFFDANLITLIRAEDDRELAEAIEYVLEAPIRGPSLRPASSTAFIRQHLSVYAMVAS